MRYRRPTRSPRPARHVMFVLMAVMAAAGTIAFTVAPLYRLQTVGLDPFQLVVVGSAMEATVFVAEIPTGIVADAVSRRLSIIIGHAGMGLGFLVEAAWPTFAGVMAGQVLWGLAYTFTSGATTAWLTGELGDPDRDGAVQPVPAAEPDRVRRRARRAPGGLAAGRRITPRTAGRRRRAGTGPRGVAHRGDGRGAVHADAPSRALDHATPGRHRPGRAARHAAQPRAGLVRPLRARRRRGQRGVRPPLRGPAARPRRASRLVRLVAARVVRPAVHGLRRARASSCPRWWSGRGRRPRCSATPAGCSS